MAKILYQGHASFRLTAANGTVVYIDPYAGEGYDAPADVILITHQHGDHNVIELPVKKRSCEIITEKEALAGGKYNRFLIGGIGIEAVEAYNKNHKRNEGVGYIISVDGVFLYISGDTSKTKQMESLAVKRLDYAFLCCDGVYNMDVAESSACAKLIGAKRSIPTHMKPGALFDRSIAEQFECEGRMIMEPGEEIEL